MNSNFVAVITAQIMKLMLLLFAVFALPALAHDDSAEMVPPNVQIHTEKLSDTTYMLTGFGGNMGLSVGDDAVLLVDDEFAPLTPKIKAEIAKLTKKPVSFVINTHWHFDHTGGNANFAAEGSTIVAHEKLRQRMATDQVLEFLKMPIKAAPKVALPVITYSNDMTFHTNGDEVRVFHIANAHTDGDSLVQFKRANVLQTGDIFTNRTYPYIDKSGGGSVEGMLAAVDQLLALVDDHTKIIPGHGSLGNKQDLAAFRQMLSTVYARVQEQMAQGKDLTAVVASKPSAEYDADWGVGFLTPDQFIAMLYDLNSRQNQ
jgi:cyclase